MPLSESHHLLSLCMHLPICESYSRLLCTLGPSWDGGSDALGIPTGAADGMAWPVGGASGGIPQFPIWFSGGTLVPEK